MKKYIIQNVFDQNICSDFTWSIKCIGTYVFKYVGGEWETIIIIMLSRVELLHKNFTNWSNRCLHWTLYYYSHFYVDNRPSDQSPFNARELN